MNPFVPAYSTRRRFLAGTLAAAAAAGLAACGDESDDGGGSGGSSSGGRASGAFPATVEHKHGTTTIEQAPARVVSYGYTDQDSLLALGAVPVGILQWIPQWKRGVGPWSERALGSARPRLFKGEEIDFEGVAEARPDLISAVNFELDEAAYDKLSQIAPTVATVDGYPAYGTPWDVVAEQVGAALGKPDEMAKLIAGARGRFEQVRKDHAGWRDKQVMIVTPAAGGKMSIFADTDTRGRFVASLGFKQSPEVTELVGDQFYADISPERFDLLDGDALIVLADATAVQAQLRDSKAYQRLDVVRSGRVVTVDDVGLSMALSASTVTSIPYALDRLVPQLERVLA